LGPVYQAGTLSGNPIAMTAGLAMLRYLNSHSETYTHLDETTLSIVNGMKGSLQKLGLSYKINHIGSMYSLFFTSEKVVNFVSAKTSDTVKFGRYFQSMLSQGIYLAPSQFESLFVSTEITDDIVEEIVFANEKALLTVL